MSAKPFRTRGKKWTLQFRLGIDPPTTTAQTRRVNWSQRRFYDGPKLKEARDILRWSLAEFRPSTPLVGPLKLHVVWEFPLARTSRKKEGEYRTSRPDTDNLQKMIKDLMTELGYWKDDAQVVSEHAEKLWSSSPGIVVKILQLPKVKGT